MNVAFRQLRSTCEPPKAAHRPPQSRVERGVEGPLRAGSTGVVSSDSVCRIGRRDGAVRVEPDRQGHHSSEAPACHRCGVPLLEETTFCPYCERWLDDAGDRPRASRRPGVASRITERTLLTIGFVFFAAVAAVCVAVALLI